MINVSFNPAIKSDLKMVLPLPCSFLPFQGATAVAVPAESRWVLFAKESEESTPPAGISGAPGSHLGEFGEPDRTNPGSGILLSDELFCDFKVTP